MPQTLVIHDFDPTIEPTIAPSAKPFWPADWTIFPALPMVAHCRGCFGCWVKTPGRCLIGDRGADFVGLLAASDRLWVVSRLVFGGLSPAVKAVFDRSIGYILPFFVTFNNKMRHVRRFEKELSINYCFYSHNMTETEKNAASDLALANVTNFRGQLLGVDFVNSLTEAKEVLDNQANPR
ncbi:MAG: flavodoxin family protein [Deltaproteobacteria bacterium]|jgi:multimeric flavodoxin WrbA|nr:flavodoxin family protein [Deltaproteobacteria bacterium]